MAFFFISLLFSGFWGCAKKNEVQNTVPVSSLPKKSKAPASPPAKGQSCEKDIKQVMRMHSLMVKNCLEKRLQSRPGLKGRLVLALKVDDYGRVMQSRVTTNTTKDNTIEACVRSNAFSWGFPKGCSGWLSFPFVLKPGKQLPGKNPGRPIPIDLKK